MCTIVYRLSLAAAFSCAAFSQAFAVAQKSQPALAPEQKSQVNKLLAEYRAAGSDAEKKRGIYDKVMAIDASAAPIMLAAIERDLQPQVKRYLSKFQAQAVAAVKQKLARVDMKKVTALRQSVLDLQKLGDGFTKDVIHDQIDPAVAKLREVFVTDRSEILDKSPDLQKEREKLIELGRLWETCKIQVPEPKAIIKHVKDSHGDDNHRDDKHGENSKETKPASFEDYLQGEEELAASMAMPIDPRTRTVLATNEKLAAKLDPEEGRCILELNITRTLLGLNALVIDLNLCAAARDHSTDMEKLNFFSHESPVSGKKSFTDRAKNFGTTAGGENIFAGVTSGKTANDGWFHSPGHHRNQMGKSTRVGVGRCGSHFTQMFGG